MTLKVVGIMGMSYCGSTAFGMALGSHPKMQFVGEVIHATLDPVPDVGKAILCASCWEKCSIWKRDEYPYNPAKVHQILADRLETSVLIDSSKLASNFARFKEADIEWFYVVLIKSPERQLASNKRNHKQNFNVRQTIAAYSEVYERIREFLCTRRYVVSDYTAFAKNPLPLLEKVVANVDLCAGQLDPVDYKKHNVYHQISGNWHAISTGAPIHVDETWTDFQVDDANVIKSMEPVYKATLALKEQI